jgi:hypothetical protein
LDQAGILNGKPGTEARKMDVSSLYPAPPEGVADEQMEDLQNYFPGLAIPRPLMEEDRVEIPPLTEAEKSMTVEEWIRAEMQRQFEKLQLDGEMAIERFRLRAQEVRQRISAL